MLKLSVLVLAVAIAGCGSNQVKIEIRGGDGQLVRLDANDVQYKFNHLVKAGTYVLPELDSKIELGGGSYAVNVAAGDYMENKVLQVESPPLWGVRTYEATFDIPAGSNAAFKREGTILYASTKKNVRSWDLFTIKADGSERQQLTDTREPEQHPSWSPDGKKILFTRGDVMTNIDLYVMDVDSANVVRLTEHPERDQRGVFSPDGETISFVSQRDGDVAVWLMAADGSNPRKLVQGRQPSFSPDGRRIAFTSSAFDDNDEIYLIDLDGSNRTRLTENRRKLDMFASFSPKGDRLVYNSEAFGGQELMIMRADGQGQTRISIAEDTYEQEPVWSPDGKGIAYAGKMGDDEYDIYLVGTAGFDLDEMDAPPLMPINLTDNDDRDDMSPSWRPY
jgi:Tol biopolymer transport system component